MLHFLKRNIFIVFTITFFFSSIPTHSKELTLSKEDLLIVDGALTAELEVAEAYRLSIKTNLLNDFSLQLGKKLLKLHTQNAQLLNNIKNQKTSSIPEENLDYDFPIEDFKTKDDILNFIIDLEMSITDGYMDAIANVNNNKLRKTLVKILIIETINWKPLSKLYDENFRLYPELYEIQYN